MAFQNAHDLLPPPLSISYESTNLTPSGSPQRKPIRPKPSHTFITRITKISLSLSHTLLRSATPPFSNAGSAAGLLSTSSLWMASEKNVCTPGLTSEAIEEEVRSRSRQSEHAAAKCCVVALNLALYSKTRDKLRLR
eukprot:3587377-Amphidinium_carterae.1